MAKRLNIITGTKYNYLEVISDGSNLRMPSGQINRTIKCKCDCGTIKEIRLLHLIRNRISSCGCKQKTMNGKSTTKLFKVWRALNRRCSENYFENHLYFKKGIKVCEDWKHTFEYFEKWSLENGYKEGLQIDRTDNSKGYAPNNCRWVTSKINTNNRDNTFFVIYDNEKYPFMILVEKLNRSTDFQTIRARIKRGWISEKAFEM
jgi:hypothetical protein